LSDIDRESDADSGAEADPAGRSRPRAGFFVHVAPAMLYVFAVFYGGSVGMSSVPGVELLSYDKLLHAVAFAGMQLVVLRAVRFELPRLGFMRQNLLALGLTSGVGILLELYQLALPHRSAELLDWVADTLGALSAAALLHVAHRRRRRPDS
jgi:hypothetical protein